MGVGGPQEGKEGIQHLLSSPGKGANGILYQGLCFRESWYQILLGGKHLALASDSTFAEPLLPTPSLFALNSSLFYFYLKVGKWLSYPSAPHKDEKNVLTGHLSWEKQWEEDFYAMATEPGYLII